VQKSTDGGKSWTDGTAFGKNGSKAQDKHWAIVDRTTNTIYTTRTQFDDYGSSNVEDKSSILFTKSSDGGTTWAEVKKINEVAGDCIDDDNTVEGAVPAIGPNGEIYVTWAGPEGIVFDKSTDGGATWLEEDIFIDAMPGGWTYDIPGINRCNGMPITVCDLSDGPNRGTIYVNWSDQRNGEDDTDIWFSKSTDGGESWSAPIRVNDDPAGSQQFLSWMTIDQTNGKLYFVFYDRRNYEDTQTDVYMAMPGDGGQTFTNFKISDSPFTPNAGIFFWGLYKYFCP
jgi:Neuraminidase (sialidase)